jgi:uncharacterized DUF497 family protein
MLFEWDEVKRRSNTVRHGVDLADGQLVLDGRPVVTIVSIRGDEVRFVSSGRIGAKYYSVVWRPGVTRRSA